MKDVGRRANAHHLHLRIRQAARPMALLPLKATRTAPTRDVVQRIVGDGHGAHKQGQDAAEPKHVARQVGQVGGHADQGHLLPLQSQASQEQRWFATRLQTRQSQP